MTAKPQSSLDAAFEILDAIQSDSQITDDQLNELGRGLLGPQFEARAPDTEPKNTLHEKEPANT